jgi:hypothetical protein
MTPPDTVTTDSLVKEQLTLLIEQELRYQLDDIIQRMQTLATNFKIGQKGDRRSPLRNLLITATDRTASIEVIKNYIEYQAARSEDVSKVLKLNYEGEKFGKALIKALDELKLDAKQILNNIIARLPEQHPLVAYLTPTLPTRELADLHLRLAQLYLGYLMREHTSLRQS